MSASAAGEDAEPTLRGRPVAVVISVERCHRSTGQFRTFAETHRASRQSASRQRAFHWRAFRHAFDLEEVGPDEGVGRAVRDRRNRRDLRPFRALPFDEGSKRRRWELTDRNHRAGDGI